MEKAEQGIWPTKAPLGYLNVTASDGRKVIEPDAELAPMITRLFERYSTGGYSLKAITKAAHAEGLVYPKSGHPVPVSTVHSILRNRLYTGLFQWNGKLHHGKHEPLVSIELWERVQGVLAGRHATPIHSYGYEFAFGGLMTCARCGCAVVAEIKKGKYVYYHCTGHSDKGRGGHAECRRKYVREEVLDETFGALLDKLHFDEEVLDWVRDALKLATPMGEKSRNRRSCGARRNISAARIGFRQCTWTSSRGRQQGRRQFRSTYAARAAAKAWRASGLRWV